MLKFLAFADKAGAVEDDDQGACGVHGGGGDGRDLTEGSERHAADDEGHAEEEVLIDHGTRAAGELDEKWQAAEVIVHERDGGAVNGDFAARRAHGDADVARGQGGRVVYAIPDDRDFVAFGFYTADK